MWHCCFGFVFSYIMLLAATILSDLLELDYLFGHLLQLVVALHLIFGLLQYFACKCKNASAFYFILLFIYYYYIFIS